MQGQSFTLTLTEDVFLSWQCVLGCVCVYVHVLNVLSLCVMQDCGVLRDGVLR